MKERNIVKTIRGQKATDGAGVHLVRVLGYDDVKDFDPFLMLDSFDSTDSADYIAGFPMHPHRGIETITYLISGEIKHKDSLGNKGTIKAGESQWMTAGSGILHEEMPQESDRMLGFQLWLNLPKDKKMTDSAYLTINKDMIPQIDKEAANIRIISGEFENETGIITNHIPATIYDITLTKGNKIDIPTNIEETVFVFLILGEAVINQQVLPSKTAVLFGEGDFISINAKPDSDVRFIYYSAKPLHEHIAWGGPIVMNTYEELEKAFEELERGTFIKHK